MECVCCLWNVPIACLAFLLPVEWVYCLWNVSVDGLCRFIVECVGVPKTTPQCSYRFSIISPTMHKKSEWFSLMLNDFNDSLCFSMIMDDSHGSSLIDNDDSQ